MDDYIKSLLKDFFEEALEMMVRLEENILILEKDYNNTEAIQEIFRAVHTLKGSAGSVEMFDIQKYSHNFEDLLDLIRSNRIKVNRDTIDILLHACDTIKILVENASLNRKYKGNLDKDISFLERFKESNTLADTKSKKIENKKESKTKKSRNKKEEVLQVHSVDGSVSKDVGQDKDLESANIEVNEKIKKTIIKNRKKELITYLVEVSFNENNPMRSVGSIQTFISLRDFAEVITTKPSLEELEGNDFYKTVYFLISTKKSSKDILDIVNIADMTTNVKVEEYSIEESKLVNEDNNAPANLQEKIEDKKKDKPKETEKQNVFLRVESDKIDAMMNQVGELVTNKSSYQQYDESFHSFIKTLDDGLNEIRKYYKDSITQVLRRFEGLADKNEIKDIKNNYLDGMNEIVKNISSREALFTNTLSKYRGSYQLLTRVTIDLQETVMKIRMVAISQIFNRFTRLIRDLSHELGKEVELKIYGEETELDKSVIEILYDPILHLIRNSMDHGIEHPDDRVKLGKSRSATLKLTASNEGNIIIIKVSDDGAGVNTGKVFDSAVKKGLILPDAKLSEKEILDIIFLPGFSTADKVSNVSGRGVGMDVVRKSLEKINGSINIETEKNVGSTFTLKIPLTLAILQTLIVESEQEYYAIPINAIIETMKVEVSDLDIIEGVSVIKIRDELVSVISIKELFNLPNRNQNNSCYIVIVSSEGKKIALLTNSLVGEQDIVIKALNDKIIKSDGIVGATILGDGTVSFILDVQAMVSLGIKVAKEKDKHTETNRVNVKSFLENIKNINSKKENTETPSDDNTVQN